MWWPLTCRPYAGDKILAALFGGVCIGVAVALVFLRGSTTGGTDIVSRLLQRRWPFMPIGKTMVAVDAVDRGGFDGGL